MCFPWLNITENVMLYVIKVCIFTEWYVNIQIYIHYKQQYDYKTQMVRTYEPTFILFFYMAWCPLIPPIARRDDG